MALETTPHSGPQDVRCLFDITRNPLSTDELVNAVLVGSIGAIVTFTGTVRDNNEGRKVVALEYEAYDEMAVAEMARIGSEMVAKWGLHGIAIRHRVGRLSIGEASVVIAASSPHRREAFEACSEALDLLKARVPIWKKEYFEDGEHWVGIGAG
ncbi:MAG TPA: molybdenum cofactor biosynthesis protein MoaE [Chloroflexia bacterium]|nr:molybdenum cofactor biosynthesis protein MoaE [Chloroflexia bacterium]